MGRLKKDPLEKMALISLSEAEIASHPEAWLGSVKRTGSHEGTTWLSRNAYALYGFGAVALEATALYGGKLGLNPVIRVGAAVTGLLSGGASVISLGSMAVKGK